MLRAIRCLVLLTSCSQILGIDQLQGRAPDDAPAGGGLDAASDAPADAASDAAASDAAPPPLVVSGTVLRLAAIQVADPLPGASVSIIHLPDGTAAVTDTSDANGQFQLVAAANRVPADGVVRVLGDVQNFEFNRDVIVYPGAPLVADTVLTALQVGESVVAAMAQQAGAPNDGFGFGLVFVRTASGDPAPNVVVHADSEIVDVPVVRYDNPQGAPSPLATATSTDGIAMLFSVRGVPLTISAQAPPATGLRYETRVIDPIFGSQGAIATSIIILQAK